MRTPAGVSSYGGDGRARWLRVLIDPAWLERHQWAFIGVNGVLTLVNLFVGHGWWAFWSLFGWGILFFFHLCLVRATHVDDEWVDERTDDLRLKSYDLSHIDDIDRRYNTGARVSATRRARKSRAPVEHRYPLVDAHVQFRQVELGSGTPSSGEYPSYLPPNFTSDVGALNVSGAVHVEGGRSPGNEIRETRWIHELHAEHGLPSAMVARARLAGQDVAAVLSDLARYPLVRAVRDWPAVTPGPEKIQPDRPGSLGDPAWRAGYALLQAHGFACELALPYWHLPEAAELAEAFPRTLLVIEHAGLPVGRDEETLEAWARAMRTAAAASNVVLKISGLGNVERPERTMNRHLDVVLAAIDIFGTERCMFGSNFPEEHRFAPYERIMRGFMEMTRTYTLAERRDMFHDNAVAFYRLDR